MDLVSLFAPILAIGMLIERVLEAGFEVIETIPQVKKMKTDDPARYSSAKLISSTVIAIVLGLLITNWLDIAFFAQLKVQGLDANADKLLSGAIAGARIGVSTSRKSRSLKKARICSWTSARRRRLVRRRARR